MPTTEPQSPETGPPASGCGGPSEGKGCDLVRRRKTLMVGRSLEEGDPWAEGAMGRQELPSCRETGFSGRPFHRDHELAFPDGW